ncbi:heat shock protein 30-like [Xiphophorus hellerii]|uniref:heat shock protein 30-like n=1 Tax=Xiphophorus hellerii TaxID=8084 RepID=UPI0013B42D46|nr:heat shock protein 30-like [Xiphophorus hellerii]
MLCSHGFPSALSPFMDFSWPGRSLWPEVRPLFYQQHVMQRDLQELRSSLQLMDKLQRQILEDTEPFRSSVALQPVSYQLDKEGEHFGLTLDTQGFSPEDLSVRQVGRKLRVSGKMEKKQEDGKGYYSYSLQEFRQEFDLPERVNHEDVSCHLSPDGKLHIQAAKVPCIEGTERELTIKRSSEEEPQQSVCSQAEDSRAETQNGS